MYISNGNSRQMKLLDDILINTAYLNISRTFDAYANYSIYIHKCIKVQFIYTVNARFEVCEIIEMPLSTDSFNEHIKEQQRQKEKSEVEKNHIARRKLFFLCY